MRVVAQPARLALEAIGTTEAQQRKNIMELSAQNTIGNIFDDAPIISTYTRADALEDGQLVDVTKDARERGFKVPVALTRNVWETCVSLDERFESGQSESGRLHDVLFLAFVRARASKSGEDLVDFNLTVRNAKIEVKSLWLHVGPGDRGEAVITIMLPEDY